MKKLFVPIFGLALFASVSGCTRCYVCRDKDSDTFLKAEYCDKDFDKGDIKEAIEDAEDNGATCHAKMRAF
jgi:hypothetical protein